jgi:hypothetical protein
MAGHANAKTIGLYDRRNDDINVGWTFISFAYKLAPNDEETPGPDDPVIARGSVQIGRPLRDP